MRGLKVETKVQYAISVGSVVKRAKKRVVRSPPLSFHDIIVGIRITSSRSKEFEKLPPPGPSAGRGAFLIAGD